MSTKTNSDANDFMAVEVEARRLRANWVRSLLKGRNAK